MLSDKDRLMVGSWLVTCWLATERGVWVNRLFERKISLIEGSNIFKLGYSRNGNFVSSS